MTKGHTNWRPKGQEGWLEIKKETDACSGIPLFKPTYNKFTEVLVLLLLIISIEVLDYYPDILFKMYTHKS